DWKGNAVAVDPDTYYRAGAVTYWARRYVKRDQAVTVILMCGPVGKMAVHTPEVCYQGAGYEMAAPAAQAVRHGPGGAGDEVFTAGSRKRDAAGGTSLRLSWSGNAAGSWRARDWPRLTSRGEPFLYKLYVVHELGADSDRPEADPSLDLLRRLLPVLD